jgi:RNA polymerase sigma factor (sigma-70 family)
MRFPSARGWKKNNNRPNIRPGRNAGFALVNDRHSQIVACIPNLRRYARALMGNSSAADDLVQDTLERAWKKLSLWRSDCSMRAWLFGIMHNLHIDQRRRHKSNIVPIDDNHFRIPTRPTQNDNLEVDDLTIALQQLSQEHREVLLLVTLEDMSYGEIAVTLGIPTGTVMSRLARAREKLRGILAAGEQTNPLKVVK